MKAFTKSTRLIRKDFFKMKNTENYDSEIWKDVVGFENLYQVSNLGRVKSLERKVDVNSKDKKKHKRQHKERIMKQWDNTHGYMCVRLMKNGEKHSKRVNRLVGQAFLDNPDNKPIVNHIDGNKKNNHLSNLEWCTHQENNLHAIDNELREVKIPEKTAKYIRDRYDENDIRYTAKAFAVRFGISESYVKSIANGDSRNNAV